VVAEVLGRQRSPARVAFMLVAGVEGAVGRLIEGNCPFFQHAPAPVEPVAGGTVVRPAKCTLCRRNRPGGKLGKRCPVLARSVAVERGCWRGAFPQRGGGVEVEVHGVYGVGAAAGHLL